LVPLLGAIGYREQDGIYLEPKHTAVFLGEFVDRGPWLRR
jgi:hypothetical protein